MVLANHFIHHSLFIHLFLCLFAVLSQTTETTGSIINQCLYFAMYSLFLNISVQIVFIKENIFSSSLQIFMYYELF